MENQNIDNRVYSLLCRTKRLKHKVMALKSMGEDKHLKEWMDGSEVCLMLNISSRTLYNYRSTGKLPFTSIEGKCYYMPSDVSAILENSRKQ